MKKNIFLISLILSGALFGCDFFEDDIVTYEDCENINLAVIWNGISGIYPSTGTDNPVAAKVRQDTKINVNFTFYDGFENDNLMRIFAVGKNMPDVIMAPYWGGGDACSATIRQAVEDGLLIPVDQYLEQYAPNLLNSWEIGVSENFQSLELTDPVFEGKKYFIPMQTPAAGVENLTNWGYTVYCRDDILKSLNVDPNSIHTSNDIYELAKKIQNGNFRDINGNKIIVASTFANGWSYECYVNSFRSRKNMTNIIQNSDGTLDWICNSTNLEEEIKFMNKMINEGLFDKTAFSHNENTVIQKMITGGVGMTATIYSKIKQTLSNTLYLDHPEMTYVPLGPIYDANGEPCMPNGYREASGEYGFPVLLVTKDCKDPTLVMKYLNYINSPEGKLLGNLGIEGEDWEYDSNNNIVRTDLWKAEFSKNPNYAIERGTKYLYIGMSQVPYHLINQVDYADDEIYQKVTNMYPVKTVTGTFANTWDEEYSKIEYFRNILSAMSYQTTIESAYCAKTQEDAMDILYRYRNNLKSGGYLEEYLSWLSQKVSTEQNVIF